MVYFFWVQLISLEFTIVSKLARKISCQGHVYFKFVGGFSCRSYEDD